MSDFVPAHRKGGVKPIQRAMLKVAPLANKVGDLGAPPMAQSAKALRTTTAAKIVGGTAKTAGMYLLAKGLTGHDAFGVQSW